MNDYARPSSSRNLINELTVQNEFLRAQIQSLNTQITDLKAENAALRSSATSHWAPQFAQVHNALRYNTLALPAAIESLAIMQQHFHRQGTLRQWYDQSLSSH
jgi:dynactin complex subunit